ncbi:MAG: response regulator transcription factor [Deltaproteobacteria bacterium]|nr:response regulator transcription factor [Candidatus Anaeroferrophillus wilburensis]MBN2888493.1 response regulator transcription factor [Deltaproteobacteria bacterium]
MKILVIEDEQKVANFLQKGLKEEQYIVDVAYDGIDGEHLATSNDYDLILLDIMMPGKDGFEVLRSLRTRQINIPVIMLTAKEMVEDKLEGFAAGCDDYITKPFSFEELLARIRVVLRRGSGARSNILTFADLTLDLISHKVIRGDKEIELTAKEYALLEYLVRNPNRVLTRTMIAQHVWDYNFDSFTNVIDVYINYLRNKVDKGFANRLIHTVRGVGYVMKEEQPS